MVLLCFKENLIPRFVEKGTYEVISRSSDKYPLRIIGIVGEDGEIDEGKY